MDDPHRDRTDSDNSLASPLEEAEEEYVTCVICRDEYPCSDSNLSRLIRRPCPIQKCAFICCVACLKDMFDGALRDSSRFPPRCCRIIPLHAFSGLSRTDKVKFKDRFEEWITPAKAKLYCPISSCAAFIPPRFVGQDARCPKCNTSVCQACKSVAHSNKACEPDEFSETRALIEKLGYKLCPGCGSGVRRMWGCSHVQCPLCGMGFCFACLRPLNQCVSFPGVGCDEDCEDGCECYRCMPRSERSSGDAMGDTAMGGNSNSSDSDSDDDSSGDSDENIGDSDENIGDSDENIGDSDENIGDSDGNIGDSNEENTGESDHHSRSDAAGPIGHPAAGDVHMTSSVESTAEAHTRQPTLGISREAAQSEPRTRPSNAASEPQETDLDMQDLRGRTINLGEEPPLHGFRHWGCSHADLATIEQIPADDSNLCPAQSGMECHLCWKRIHYRRPEIPESIGLWDKVCTLCGLFMCYSCSRQLRD